MTTLRDIAKAACVSTVTVSHVLNERPGCFASEVTKQRIRLAAEQMGYSANYFARGLRQRKSSLIGIVGGFFETEITAHLISGVAAEFQNHGCAVIFNDTRTKLPLEEQAMKELRAWQVDGLIFHAVTGHATESLRLIPLGIPCVLLSAEKLPGYPCVVIDRAEGVKQAVRRLVELGHKRIAFMTAAISGNTQKLAGYKDALRAAGLLDEKLIHESADRVGSTREYVAQHEAQFRQVTVVLCTNDIIAIEVMSALKTLGLEVPRDCSVVGHDDIDVAEVTSPRLTTLRQPRDALRKHAVDMLLRLMKGEKVRSVTLVPELIERDSTGPCGKG